MSSWRSSFAKDASHVYFNNQIASQINTQSARIFSDISGLIVDKNHVYIANYDGPKIIEGVDSNTLTIDGDVTEVKDPNGWFKQVHAHDKNQKYIIRMSYDGDYLATTIKPE